MKSLLETDLRKMVLNIVGDIPKRYRCYEITRTLKKKLGLNVEVKDGYVFYCFQTFLTEAYIKNCAISLKNLENIKAIKTASRITTTIADKQEDLGKNLLWRIGVKHSWCILPEEKCLIDYHRLIETDELQNPLFEEFPTLKELEIKNFLMIVPLKKLPNGWGYRRNNVIYMERAVQKGNIIRYKDGKYATKLRL